MNQPLETRVLKLEKSLRMYRLCFLGVFILAAGLLTMSFRTGKTDAPDLIQAKKIQVVDDMGNVLVDLSKEYSNGKICTYSQGGRKLVSLFTAEGGSGGINTFDNDGDVLFKVTRTSNGGAYMALFNSQRTEICEWGTTNVESGYFRLNDKYGEKLAWLTYTQDGGGYFSLSNKGTEMFRFSTPDEGGRMGLYNGYNKRVVYMGAQDNRDGNITTWNSSGTFSGAMPR